MGVTIFSERVLPRYREHYLKYIRTLTGRLEQKPIQLNTHVGRTSGAFWGLGWRSGVRMGEDGSLPRTRVVRGVLGVIGQSRRSPPRQAPEV